MSELQTALQELTQKKFPVTPIRELKSGKEAKVWVVKSENDDSLYALKTYHDFKSRAFQTQKNYLQDRFIGDGANIRRAIRKGNDVGKQFIQDTWVMREQYFLKTLAGQSSYIPRMVKPLRNGVLMEYIGDENGPAPRLSDLKIPPEVWQSTAEILIELIDLFLANGIIHGDLSAFNILWWNDRPIVIDFPQAIDVRESKRVPELLKRDIKNVLSYFKWDDELTIEEIANDMLDRYHIAH
ncbi:MAG: RIO1 family regulatory kinase/ATPase [Patescibacteria group bacterium]